MSERGRVQKRMSRLCIGSVMLLLLIQVNSFLSYSAASPSQHQVSLVATAIGTVSSAGNQQYTIQQHGIIMSSAILGFEVIPSTSHLDYLLLATVDGLSTTGIATFGLTGMNSSGWKITVNGTAPIVGSIPAISLPIDCGYNQTVVCTSEVPALFSGNATVQVVWSKNSTQTRVTMVIPMLFESSYLNPFGNPIFLGSDDFSSISIVTTYSLATVNWNGVVSTGEINGTIGKNTKVSGNFVEVTRESENLVSGKAVDGGTISLDGMIPSYLNSAGPYIGSSWIPLSGEYACSGVPVPAGACTTTGYSSSGALRLQNEAGSRIIGGYQATWSAPAISSTCSVSASVTQWHVGQRVPSPITMSLKP